MSQKIMLDYGLLIYGLWPKFLIYFWMFTSPWICLDWKNIGVRKWCGIWSRVAHVPDFFYFNGPAAWVRLQQAGMGTRFFGSTGTRVTARIFSGWTGKPVLFHQSRPENSILEKTSAHTAVSCDIQGQKTFFASVDGPKWDGRHFFGVF